MKALISLLCALCVLLLPSSTWAEQTYRFRTFSPKGGFYYDGLVDINQDSEGFIWIMLDGELLRFDGYEFRKYTSQFSHDNFDSDWSFVSFDTDSAGGLHVLTSDALYRHIPFSGSFQKIRDVSLSNMGIDGHNNIWGMKGSSLHRISGDSIIPCLYDNLPVKSIRSYSFTPGKAYFASRYNRIYSADSGEPDKIDLLYLFPPDHSIVSIKAQGDNLWVLTAHHGIYRINTRTRNVDKHLTYPEDPHGGQPKALLVDKHGHLWVGTQNGLYIIDPESGQQHYYRHNESDPFSLTNNSVWILFSDSHGNVWTGHFAGGLGYADLDDRLQVNTFTTTMSPLNYELVSSFAESDDDIFIGTDGGGLNRMSKRDGTIMPFRQRRHTVDRPFDHVKSLSVDSMQRLWIAHYRGGLDCFNLKSGHLDNFHNTPGDSTALKYDDLRKIAPDANSGLWIAYQNINTTISRLSFSTGKCEHFNLSDSAGYVFDIHPDKEGNLYVLTRKELFRIDSKTGTFEKITGGNISGGQSLASDSGGNIWIGTVGRGLMCYVPSRQQFEYFPDILSPFASAVYSMSHDPTTDCLWIGTDNGLIQFQLSTRTIRRFDENEGFQGSVYYPLASFRSKAGEMFFGGTNGFSVFNPSTISPNPRQPRPRISGVYIDNEPAPASVWQSPDKIVLRHDQTNFGFTLSSDNYQTPNKNRFRYRLKGYDDNWITTGATARTVTYSKVPPGEYQFEVLASNNDGVWSGSPATIRIVRRPAPWASPLAYLFYTLIAAALIWAFFHYRNEKRRLKLKLFINDLDKKKKEELHKSQLSFFTNISHDFRTPISLIMAAIDNMKQEGIKDYYYRILHNNSRRLLNLVNELMDFRTLDNHKMRLQVSQTDVNLFVREIASDFTDYAAKRNIDFTISCDPEIPSELWIDRQVLEKVVLNLLNNAFKYTPDGGEIIIETFASASDITPRFANHHSIPSDNPSACCLTLAVRDTGCGISADSIREIFERYYLVNTTNLNQHLGTGIGLALVKSLVRLHHGSISVYSERNQGTDIIVSLPARRSDFDDSETAPDGMASSGCSRSLPDNYRPYIADHDSPPDTLHEGAPEESEDSGRKRILLVEDNEDLRKLIAGFLRLHYDVVEAGDGEEAIEKLKESGFDLIVSDVMMPRKDGITLCREVKADFDTSHIPVVLLTAKGSIDDRIEGTEAGADLYFAKPIDFNLLYQSLRNIFRHQENLREHYSRNYFADKKELTSNRKDIDFLNRLSEIIDSHLRGDDLDVNLLASEMCMSRSKLYSKLKALTGKSIVEFIMNCRMRKAARLIVEQDMPFYIVMEEVGIRSQSHFVTSFKKEFGETPSSFLAKHRSNPLT